MILLIDELPNCHNYFISNFIRVSACCNYFVPFAEIISGEVYSNVMICNHLNKFNEHPIYLTLENIPSWIRNKPDAKVLIGYLPKLKAKDYTSRRIDELLIKFILTDVMYFNRRN